MRLLHKAAILVAGAFLVAAPLRHASSQAPENIVVESADGLLNESFATNNTLTSLLASTVLHVQAEFANAVKLEILASPASGLLSQLSAVPARVAVEFSNGGRVENLAAPSAPLTQLLTSNPARVAIEFSNGNGMHSLAYPKMLLNDRQAPAVTQYSTDGVKIRWVTNEFVTSVVQVGLRSGSYTQTFTDPVFRKEHELTLPSEVVNAVAAAEAANIPDAAAATYFVRIVSTDLSGNQSTSQEYRAQALNFIYLPMVDR